MTENEIDIWRLSRRILMLGGIILFALVLTMLMSAEKAEAEVYIDDGPTNPADADGVLDGVLSLQGAHYLDPTQNTLEVAAGVDAGGNYVLNCSIVVGYSGTAANLTIGENGNTQLWFNSSNPWSPLEVRVENIGNSWIRTPSGGVTFDSLENSSFQPGSPQRDDWKGIYINSTNPEFTNLINDSFIRHCQIGIYLGPGVGGGSMNTKIDNCSISQIQYYGIYCNATTNVLINNTNIFNVGDNIGTEPSYGIYLNNCSNDTISLNQISNIDDSGTSVGEGIHLEDCYNETIRSNNPITDIGLSTSGVGINISGSNNNTFDSNNITNIGSVWGIGIYMDSSYANSFNNNVIYNVTDYGIHMVGSDSNDFIYDIIGFSIGEGVGGGLYLEQSFDNTFATLTFDNITDFNSIELNNSGSNTLINLTIDNVQNGYGIWIYSDDPSAPSDYNTIDNATISNTSLSGIYLDGSSEPIQNTTIENSEIYNTSTGGGFGHGIEMVNTYNTSVNQTTIHNISGSPGIFMDASWYSMINDTEIYSITGGDGIEMNNSHWNTLNRNWIHDVGLNGINIFLSDNNSFYSDEIGTNSIAWNIGGNGTRMKECSLNNFYNTQIEECSDNGFYMVNSGTNTLSYVIINNIQNGYGFWIYSDGPLALSDFNSIDNASISNTSLSGIYLDGSSESIQNTAIENSEIFNTSTGSGFGPGIEMLNTFNTSVNQTTIHNISDSPGIFMDSCWYSMINDTEIYSITGADGIEINKSHWNTFNRNWIHNIDLNGIFLNLSDNNRFYSNEIGTNSGAGNIGDNGIIIEGSNLNYLFDTEIEECLGDGLFLSNSGSNNFDWLNISSIGGDGVYIVSDGGFSDYNNITNALVQYIGGSGVFIDGRVNAIQNTTILDCEIAFTGQSIWGPGIRMLNAYNTTITFADIHNISNSPGLYMDASWYSTVNDTEIYFITGADGVEMNNSHWITFNRNWIHDVDLNGIFLNLSDNNDFNSNEIGTNSGAGNIGHNGIIMEGSNLNFFFDTEIEECQENGLSLSNSGSNNFDWLNISDIGGEGVYIVSYGGLADYNNITNALIHYTDGSGIHLNGLSNPLQYTNITACEIAFTGQSMVGPGINMFNAYKTIISLTDIHNISGSPGLFMDMSWYSTVNDINIYFITSADGIEMNNSHWNTFNRNWIHDVDLNGVFLNLSDNNDFNFNEIGTYSGAGNIGHNGIIMEGSNLNFFFDTEIEECQENGLSLSNSGSNNFDWLNISDIGGDGVYIVSNGGLSDYNNITNALIQYIDGSGIFVDSRVNTIHYTKIMDSEIAFTGQSIWGPGIQMFNSYHTVINLTDIRNISNSPGLSMDASWYSTLNDTEIYFITGADGIEMNNSHSNTFNRNWVHDVELDGIYLNFSDNNQFYSNEIGTYSGAGNIGDNGIIMEGSNLNFFFDTGIEECQEDGLSLSNSGSNNFDWLNISYIGGDGVYIESDVSPSDYNNITNALIQYIDGSGILVDGRVNTIQYTKIMDSEIAFTGQSIWGPGIKMLNAYNTTITFADIHNISNSPGLYMDASWYSTVNDTEIYFITGADGVEMNNSHWITFNRNWIHDVDLDGIYLNLSDNNQFYSNEIGTNSGAGNIGYNGIIIDDSNLNYFFDTEIEECQENGLSLSNSGSNNFDWLNISDIGGDGVYIVSNGGLSDYNNITNALIQYIDGSGILVDGRVNTIQYTKIMDSEIAFTGQSIWGPGIQMLNAYDTVIAFTDIHDISNSPGLFMDASRYLTINDAEIYLITGADGIEMNNSHWITFNRNWIHDVDLNGIFLNLSDNNDFYSNEIGTNSGAGNIGDNGVIMEGSNLNFFFDTEIEECLGDGLYISNSGSNNFVWLNISNIASEGVYIISDGGSSDYNNITNARIQNIDGSGIYLDGGLNPINHTRLRNCEISNVGQVSGQGMYMLYVDDNLFDRAYIHDIINGSGIYMEDSNSNTFRDIRVYNINLDHGIHLYASSNNDFDVNTFTLNQIYGISNNAIHVENSSTGNSFNRMEIYNIGGYGVRILRNSQSNVVNSTTIYDTSSYGIYVSDSDANTITNNNIYDTVDYGIIVDQSADTLINDNDIYSTAGNDIFAGIWLQDISGNTVVSWNAIHDLFYNGTDVVGIYLSGQDAEISNNTINNFRSEGGGMALGIVLDISPDNIVYWNHISNITSSDSMAVGILLASSNRIDVLSNDLSYINSDNLGPSSFGVGVYVTPSDSIEIWDNSMIRCDLATFISNSTNVNIGNNMITYNNVFGIYMDNSTGSIGNNSVLQNGWGYIWDDVSGSFNWIDATGGTQVLFPPPFGADDGFITDIPIGFDFNYYGRTYNTINIMTNGWLSFVDYDWWYPDVIPSSGDGYEGVIALFGKDLNPGLGGGVYYQTFGSAPNRIFVVEYYQIENSPWIGGGNPKTMEVIFYESSNMIRFQYLVAPDDPVSIGIESHDESLGIGNGGSVVKYIDPGLVDPGVAIEFTPYISFGYGGGILLNDSDVQLYNNNINDNAYRGIDNQGSNAIWYIDDYGEAINNDIVLYGDVLVLSSGTWKLNNLDAWFNDVMVDGSAYIENCQGGITSWDLTIDGLMYLNSSSWKLDCLFDNQFGLLVNPTGTLITQDDGVGGSEITTFNKTNYYSFNVFGTLISMDTNITYGWELFINSPNMITIGDNVTVRFMETNGIHVSGSPNVWINNSQIIDNALHGMLIETGSIVTAMGSSFDSNNQSGVIVDFSSTFTADTCSFNDNQEGSGVIVSGSSTFTATTCTFNNNNNSGIVINNSITSLTGCTITGNGQTGLYGISSTITLNTNIIMNNLGNFDVHCIDSTIYSTNDTIGNILLINCQFIRYTGSDLLITGWWELYNCTGPSSVTFRSNVTVLAGGGLIIGNTTIIMDSLTPGITIALDIYGTFSAQIWNNNPNYIQGVGDVAYYFRAHAGSNFTLTDSYVENVGMPSGILRETGLWINTNHFFIRDDTIWNNFHGLIFEDVTSLVSVVGDNTITGNSGTGIYIERSSITISNNFIDNNNGYGIYWHDNLITPALNQNIITNNPLGGVFLNADLDVTISSGDISQNTIQFNGFFGFNVSAGRDINIQLLASDANIIDTNFGDGLLMMAGRNIDATINSDITNNWGDGYDIFANMRIHITIYYSLMDNNQGYGLVLRTTNLGIRAYINNNSVTNNDDGAIYIDAGGAGNYIEIKNNSIHKNGGVGIPAINLLNVTAFVSDNLITNSGGDGIHVEYSDVSIKDNYIAFSADNGIYVSFSQATIADNSIRFNYENGIYVMYSMPIIKSNIVANNNHGMVFISSDGEILDNTISSNSLNGIDLTDSNPTISDNFIISNLGNGIFMDPSAPTITVNTISGNALCGIYVYRSAGVIAENIISNNSLEGIYLVYSNPMIRNNTIIGNTISGIYVYDHSSSSIEGNTITNNYNGIYVGWHSSPTILNNEINTNYNNGIHTYNYASVTISYNTINTNSFDGIYIEDGTARITDNMIMGNDRYGIYALASTDYVSITIESNTLSNNYLTNIYLDSSGYEIGSYIANNIVESSIFGYGIEITGNYLFSVDIVDNIIRNNNFDAIYLENFGDNIVTTITGNTISNNIYGYGIEMYCDYDIYATIKDNEVIAPMYDGVYLTSFNSIYLDMMGNTVTKSVYGYGVYVSASNSISGDVTDNDISGNYYSNFYVYAQNVYITMIGNDLSNSIIGYGVQMYADFDFYVDISDNMIMNNYEDNIYIIVSSNLNPVDITIVNNDISGSVLGNGVEINVEYDVVTLISGNNLAGNRYDNLYILSTWGTIVTDIIDNDMSGGSIEGKGVYLQAEYDIHADIHNNDLAGNYEENIYARSYSRDGYFTITDNIISDSVSMQGIYIYVYYNIMASIKDNDISGNYLSNIHLETLLDRFGDVSATITGNDLNSSYWGHGTYIYADDSIYNTIVSDNWISGNYIDGLHMESNYYNWENVEITHNHLTLNYNYGISGNIGYEIYELDISYNHIADNYNSGMYLTNNYWAESITISYNTVTRNNGDGVYLNFESDMDVGFEFVCNIITNNHGYGVYFKENSGSIYGSAIFKDNYIANNFYNGLNIYIYSFCYLFQVKDNILESNGGDAINIHVDNGYIESMLISDNKITSHDGYGIYLRADYEVYIIEINDNVVTNTYDTGINLEFNSYIEEIEISRNKVTNNYYEGIYLSVLGSADQLLLNDNVLQNLDEEGIEISISDFSDNVQINRNTINNSGYDGLFIDIHSASIMQMNQNTLINCGGSGIDFNSNFEVNGLQVNRNTMININDTALHLDIGSNMGTLQVKDNHVDNIAWGYGIFLNANDGVNTVQISRNSLENTYYDGIYLDFFNDINNLQMNDNTVINSNSPDYAGIYLYVGTQLNSGELLRNNVTNVAQGYLSYGIYVHVVNWIGQMAMNYNTIYQTQQGGIYFETGYADLLQFNDNTLKNTQFFGIRFSADLASYNVDSFELNRNHVDNTFGGVHLEFDGDVGNGQIIDNKLTNIYSDYGLYLRCDGLLGLLEFKENYLNNVYYGAYFNLYYAPNTITITYNIISNVQDNTSLALDVSNSLGSVAILKLEDNIINNTEHGVRIWINCDVQLAQINDNIIECISRNYALELGFYDLTGIFELINNQVDNSGNGVHLEFTNGVETLAINNNIISEVELDYGLYLWAGSYDVSSLQFNDNLIENTGEGVFMYFGDIIYSAQILRNTIINVARNNGLHLEVVDNVNVTQINNNNIENAQLDGIYIDINGANTIQINDNTVVNCGDRGIAFYSFYSVISAEFNRNLIENVPSGVYLHFDNSLNTLQFNNNMINDIGDSYGLYLYIDGIIQNVQIDSNIITNTYLQGMFLDLSFGPDILQFNHNTIMNSASGGLYLLSDTSMNVITMELNTIINNDGYGAYIQSIFDIAVDINDNNFSNNYDTNLFIESLGGNLIATVMDSSIANSAGGKGLELLASDELTANVQNNDISGNYYRNLNAKSSFGSGYFTIINNDLSNSIWDRGLVLETSLDLIATINGNTASNNYDTNVLISCGSGNLSITNNELSNSVSDQGIFVDANLDLWANIKNNVIVNNKYYNINFHGNQLVYITLNENEIMNSDIGVSVGGDNTLYALIQDNDITNNFMGNVYLKSLGTVYSVVSDNNLSDTLHGEGVHIESGGTLDGTIHKNNILANYNGIYLDAGASGEIIDVYDNIITGSIMYGLYAIGDISGTFYDNNFFDNHIGIALRNTETPSITHNSFSFNEYDIRLINSNTSIGYNNFDNTTEICIQSLDSWPFISWNYFENIGHEMRDPPMEPQKVLSIEFSTGESKEYQPISVIFNTVKISLAESLYTVNAPVAVQWCSFEDSPYANLHVINSIIYVNESSLSSKIVLESDETCIYMLDSDFDEDGVEFIDDGTLFVAFTTDVRVLDQFGEPQMDLDINISSTDGWYRNGYTDPRGYFNDSETIAYILTTSGKDYSMNPYNITVHKVAIFLASLDYFIVERSLIILILNDAPILNLPATINFTEDKQFKFNLDDYASDDGGIENLIYTYSGGVNITVTMDSNNVVTFFASENWYGGPEIITFRATDGLGLYAQNTVAVNVISENDEPVLVESLPDIIFEEDGALSNAFDLDAYFTDVDSILTFDASTSLNIVITIDSVTNAVSFLAQADWFGVEYITFTASDGEFIISDIVRVTVNPINDAPIITSTAITTAKENQSYTYDVNAFDTDEQYGDVLTYTLTSSPSGMTIDSVTGMITWTPTYEQALMGSFDVTGKVTDSEGAFDSQWFTITVTVDNEPPSISEIGIAPLDPKEGDTIYAIPLGWIDDQKTADQAIYLYQWFRNGEPILGASNASLNSDYFSKGDVITVTVIPYDGNKYGKAVISLAIAVLNTPPTITHVVISPQHPIELDDLIATPIGFVDPDDSDTTELYYYSWKKDGVVISGVVGNTLDAPNFEEDNVITVTVTPSDGQDSGPSVSSGTITILGDPTDSDGDGIPDKKDDHPNDYDNDGVPDINDKFPYDVNESSDIDGDGVGDNADHDKDGDGVPNGLDDFPFDPLEWVDSDGDGRGNNADENDDNDGYPDINDDFPLDPKEFRDTDKDGIGDSVDEDIDGDGVLNDDDEFPDNPLEWKDTDNDGIGDNADPDDDNDGVVDGEDHFPLDETRSLDPLWWWWIVIVILLIILMILVFITRRPTKYEGLPDEEAYIRKEERMRSRRKPIQKKRGPTRAEGKRTPKKREKPKKPTRKKTEARVSEEKKLGDMLAEGEARAYSDEELEAMSKNDLIYIAESMGLPTEGTKFALLSRIKYVQRMESGKEPEEREELEAGEGAEQVAIGQTEYEEAEAHEEVEEVEEKIECPSCGRTFTQRITGLPAEIKCPYCGVSGIIDM